MSTYIYMVRHGESPKLEGNERTRGLTEKGSLDAHRVTDILKTEGIDTFISSPYKRAVLTIEKAADFYEKEIVVYENLKECMFSNEDQIISDKEVYPLVKKMFVNQDFTLTEGESYADCQRRVVKVLKEILMDFRGQKIVVGTHGLVMTLMMNYFDKQYGFEFLMHTSKPDIYKLEFKDEQFMNVERLWIGERKNLYQLFLES
ncbi:MULTISPECIES: histidine phosphatase family protein [Bacillus]|uniref:Histidine phosphatase family protein n=1 Tax=Bacillus thuringiensis serovar sooncheon TaxID=180891 RepID=A0A9Q5X236_BACTU|nr:MULTISPECIES: histidine phosphatase family protein [Bacillus]MDC7971811.1 histidine phosphatase family protein [Bacillus sp. BLCC-B18]OTW73781.1 histidine phosphatase family protein [Bacillus thuringiensis serovar coreanensis]OTX41254.1 histidine phosphatase family protein [Bacillus thuringiensis serovar sooncheon]OTX47258.1 histidine phosphatase family protein [Bacillus thuringiensis serovar guiyangiensis]OTX65636.1 histidine phosphatase family protein [Bacillus thuringiensis serovar roski